MIEITPPVMSWDRPIENEILEFVRTMKVNMQHTSAVNMWPRTRREAQAYANAYETVEDHIMKEMKLRAEIKELRREKAEK